MYDLDHYIRLTMLGVGIAALIYVFLLVVFMALGIEFPTFLHVSVSVLGSGYLVYRFLLRRIG